MTEGAQDTADHVDEYVYWVKLSDQPTSFPNGIVFDLIEEAATVDNTRYPIR